jgi:GTP cyclohydrolase II
MVDPVSDPFDAGVPQEVAAVPMPTSFGVFQARAFECPDNGCVYLAMVMGDLSGPEPVLTRLHSECLTGDALGSLRCDCGVQLRVALRTVAAEGRGVVLYLTGHEGRGIGLVNKLRAYLEQDLGADTLEANVRLGFDPDARDYGAAGRVLDALGVRAVRLLSNNPAKAEALRRAQLIVSSVQPLPTAASARNRHYLTTKQDRLGHGAPAGPALAGLADDVVDVGCLIGEVRPRRDRPYVVVKYAQTLDGRIATGTGDSKWISGEAERRVAHALRAASDAVLVGAGTVLLDDPQLTVRMLPGASPLRVVLDSTLRTPPEAQILSDDAGTLIITTERADEERRAMLSARAVAVRTVPPGPDGVDLAAALRLLKEQSVTSLLVEGGARVITALLAAGLVDRIVVSVSPRIIGTGIEAVGPLGVSTISEGIELDNRCVFLVGDDVLLGWDVRRATPLIV